MLNAFFSKRILTFLLVLGALSLSAQQDISVRVQVNRLPDGRYPTKLYQFNSTPGLVSITLTNLTQATRTVYLTGKLTGDNGVLVATPKNYRPPTTIELGPLANRTLNAIEASYLFDANNLVYVSGNTSIKSSVFGEQGLPEGTYQLCIRAIDAATSQPLSEEDPIGCSNIFSVATLEAPMILNPYNEEALFRTAVQAIPIRWTTPPGAPPSTEYLIRIVEVFGQRNPYDAILSTSTPFFETTVKGSPLFLYTVQQPQLQEGRSYAMIIVASDPFGGATFRNNGRSEVVQFTYGAPNGVPGGQQDQPPSGGPTLEYADHTLKGHLSWAFKKSETAAYTLYTGSGGILQQTKPIPYINTSPSTNTAFALQASITPLISYNALAAVNTDQTLQQATFAVINNPISLPELALPSGILSGSGSSLASTSYTDITVDTAAERFPLAGAPVTLQAVMSAGTNRILLATGRTDKDGNFNLQFLDPAYGSGNGATRLILSINTPDFEHTEINVPLSILNSPGADLGNYTLLAKTLRLFPKLVFDSLLTDGLNGYGFHLYRDVKELEDRPWLANEGLNGAARSAPVVVDGRQMIEVAADSVLSNTPGGTGALRVLSSLDAKGGGRLFFGGNLYVKLIPASSSYREVTSTVSVLNAPIPANKVLEGRLEYHPTHRPAQVSGTVAFPMGEQGRVPVTGAQVRVTYKKADRAPGIDPNDIFKQAATATTQLNAALTPSWTNHNVSDPGTTTLQALVWTGSDLGLTTPVMIQPVSAALAPSGSAASSKLTAKAVLSPTAILPDLNPVPDDSKGITTTTDELGNYTIMLPPLKKGAHITVEVINTPSDFSRFLIEAQGYQDSKANVPMDIGASARVDFTIKGDVADVVGRVVDDQGKPLANARIDFKGTTLGSTGPDGIFQFSLYPGTHVLSLEKEGYVVKNVTINVPQLTNNTANTGYTNKWLGLTMAQKQTATLTRIGESQTVQASISRGNTFTAAMFGIAAPQSNAGGNSQVTTAYNSGLALAFGIATSSPGSQYEVPREFALDLKDIGYLDKIVGKARFRVVEDGTNTAIAGARITVFDSTHTTDEKGEWYYEGFGGSATLTLIPPSGTPYIAVQKLLTLAETGKEEVIVLSLKKGILISGIVSSGGNPLPNARILLDDQDFSGITTDASGHYAVYTTPGPHSVGARKQGYVGSSTASAGISENKTINFDLTGSNGRNYSTLLGFAIELDETSPAGAGQEKWSGNFVRLTPVDKNVFTLPAETRIPFSNLVVSFDGSGDPLPANNIVKTDVTELSLKLFGYLPVKLTGGDVITFTRASDGKGQLSGTFSIAWGSIQGYRGWSIAGANATLAGNIVLFNSGGQQPTDQSFPLTISGGDISGQLYGFTVALKTAKVDKDGLEFAGSIGTPDIAPIKRLSIPITKLAINRALSVSAVLLQTENLPALEIASWKASIQGLVFNEDGFKIGGTISLNLVKSGASLLNFSNLSIAKTGLFGGSFDLPDGGIDILALANVNSNRNPLSFGRVGTSNVYHLTGKASLKIDVSILQVPLQLPSFEILSNGDFGIQAPSDYHTSIGPFGFALTNLIINSKDNTPSIVLQGQFKADLSFLKFEVGDINIRPVGGKPVFSVSKIGVKLDVPVVKASVLLAFNNDGFEGDGGLSIPATPITGTIGFKYYKHPEGIELGAKFFANIPPVPIGGPVTLEGIGGGFTYVSGGPNGGFSVDVQGKISLLASGTLVALNPVGIHVESAGVLKGYGDMVVGSYLKKGHADVIFNGPELTFTVQVDVPMSPLEGLAEERIQGTLLISAKKDDAFAFLGCSTHAKLLDLIDNHGEMAIAVGLKNPKTREDLVSHYFEYAPDSYMQDRFSGVYLNVASHVGISKDDAIGFDLFVVSAKAWFDYGYNASLLLNFQENAYRIAFGGGFDMGVEACVLDIACVNISASMCIQVEGGRNNTLGWNFMASATGSASLGFGLGFGDCDPGCNEVVSFWDGCVGGAFKVCGNATVDLRFSEKDGIKFSARAGGSTTTCF